MNVSYRKSKGAQAEYACRDSLLPLIPDILLTKALGFVGQYDLVSHEKKYVFEVKKHRGFTWNELVGYYKKLQSKAPEGYTSFLVFQSNHQPCLVMTHSVPNQLMVLPFEDLFETKWIKHVGVKK
jgi:hypothetical protein